MPADMRNRLLVRSRCALAELKAFGGPDQPQHAHLDQVVEWHGAAAVVVDGQGAHQGALALHEPVAMLQGCAAAQPPAQTGEARAGGRGWGQGGRGWDGGRAGGASGCAGHGERLTRSGWKRCWKTRLRRVTTCL